MENRHGLVVDGDLTEASGTAERDTAVDMLAERYGRWPLYKKALLRNFANSGRPRMWHRMTDARRSTHYPT